jgi:hypothetical protein
MLKYLLVAAMILAGAWAPAGTVESVRQKGFASRGVNVGLGGFSMPDDFVILPERISKEPLGPVARRADDRWFDMVPWSMTEAEDLGVTSANLDALWTNVGLMLAIPFR